MPRRRWVHLVALAALTALLVGTMWVVPYLPTTDGPEWVFATHAENHYADPGAPYPAALIPTPEFASRGMSMVYAPLESWLGWEVGLRVALSVIVALTAWGFVLLVHSIEPARRALGFLGFPLALSWELYMGLWPFVVASGLGLFIIALVVRLRKPTWRGRLLVAALLLTQAVAHVFAAVLTGLAIFGLTLVRAPRGRRVGELGRVVAMGAPAAGVLIACFALSIKAMQVPLANTFARFPWRDALAALPRTIAPGSLGRAILVTAAVAITFVLTVVRATRSTTDAHDRGLGVVGSLFLIAAVLAPFQIPGWQFFSQRFIPLGVALVLAVLPVERFPSRLQTRVPAAFFLAAAAWLVTSYPFHRRLAALCPGALAGLHTAARTQGTILATSLRPTEELAYDDARAEVPFSHPLAHMGSLFAVVLGGVPAVSFAGVPAIHAFKRRPSTRPLPSAEHEIETFGSYAFAHEVAFRHAVLSETASYGMFYDEVTVFGALPGDLRVWQRRGFRSDWASATTLVGHFEPCSIDLAVPAAWATPPPVVDTGVGTIELFASEVVHAARSSDATAHFTVAPAPCGDVVVRPRWPPVAGQARICHNANERGELLVEVRRSSGNVVCDGP